MMTERSEKLVSLFLQEPFSMTELQRRELSKWIIEDPENAKDFIQASLFHRCIHDVLLDADQERKQILQSDETDILNADSDSFDRQLWEMLSKEEQTAPEIEIEIPEPQRELIRYVKREKVKHEINKPALFAVITSVAALILLLLYVRLVPNISKVEVATLKDTVDAKWAEAAAPTSPNARLMTNHEPLMLRKGYAELVFDNNAKVVLEAPVEFQVLSYDQIRLSYGRLYATVPKEAVGFIVSTPTTKIIDLGTEFGVQTDFNGATEVHVVKGQTSLVSGTNENKLSFLLNAGSAKKINTNDSSPTDIPCVKKIFVRQIDSKNQLVWRGQNISLADIVGGGDGFGTGQIDGGVDPLTGSIIGILPRDDVYPGPEGYVSVSSNPYIDGVFVPGMDPDQTQITATGLKTDQFPKTTGLVWGYIFNAAWHQGEDVPRHHLKLNNVVLDGKQVPAVTMHSNMGITFDLSVVREKLPGMTIKSFSSEYGISQTVEEYLKMRDFSELADMSGVGKLATKRQSSTDIWVFLDGRKLLQKRIYSMSSAGSIDIPIDDNVRFLTLAVTEADDTFMFDWAVFARPELILETADNQLELRVQAE